MELLESKGVDMPALLAAGALAIEHYVKDPIDPEESFAMPPEDEVT